MRHSKDFNNKSIRFAYDRGEVPPIRVDGNFRVFKFDNKNGPVYSLAISCTGDNESFFKKLNSALANQSCKILKDPTVTPEDFELVKDVLFLQGSTSGTQGKPGAEYPEVLIRT